MLTVSRARVVTPLDEEATDEVLSRGHADSGHSSGRRVGITPQSPGRRGPEAEAFKWFSEAAESGLPRAQFALAAMYTQGTGVAKNESAALEWLMRSAQGGVPEAQFALANRYLEDRGVPKSEEESAR